MSKSRNGNYPSGLAHSSQYAPEPIHPSRDPSGTVPKGNPNTNPPPDFERSRTPASLDKAFEYSSENPCNCYWGLTNAGKILMVLNLVYLILELRGVTVPKEVQESVRNTTNDSDSLFAWCMNFQTEKPSTFYISINILFGLSAIVLLGSTLGFMYTLFTNPGPKIKLLWSKIYMWSSFSYLGWMCYLLFYIDMMIVHDECHKSRKVLFRYLMRPLMILIWMMINGVMGRAYRNMAERKSLAMGAWRSPTSISQQGHPQSPLPDLEPRRNFEDRKENPFSFCCGLVTAAKHLTILTLYYLGMEIVDMVASIDASPYFGVPLYPLTSQDRWDPSLFYACMNWQEKLPSALYLPILIFFAVIKSAYFLATIGFLVAVFASPGRIIELLCANIFTWMSFIYAGSLLLSCLLLAILNHCDYDQYLLLRYIIFGVFIGAISIFNGLVGRAYRNIVQRRNFVSPTVSQAPQILTVVPAASVMLERIRAGISVDQNGAVHAAVPPLNPLAHFEKPSENPYNFCCGLVTAAKTISVLNLAYLVLEIIDMVISWNATPIDVYFGPHPLLPFFFEDMDLFYMCMHEQKGIRYVAYIIVLILFAVSKFVYLLATIGFMVAVFRSLGTKKEQSCFNIFTRISFGYSGTLLLSRLLIAILKDRCRYYIWSKIIISSVVVAVFAVFNGFVAKGYGRMVKRWKKMADILTRLTLSEAILSLPVEDDDHDPDVLDSQNAPGPIHPSQDPSGTVPKGNPNLPRPPDFERSRTLAFLDRVFEYSSENPCNCYWGLTAAAKILTVLNLAYLILELRGGTIPEEVQESVRNTTNDSDALFAWCMDFQSESESTFYISINILFGLSAIVLLASTLGFMYALFTNPGTKIKLLWSKIYMWSSFSYLGWLCYVLFYVDMMIVHDECHKSRKVLFRYLMHPLMILIWIMVNGLMGRAYRNMVERKSQVISRVPQGVLYSFDDRAWEHCREFENRSENPFSFCCGLVPAAKHLTILTLFYLGLEIIEMVTSINASPYFGVPLFSLTSKDRWDPFFIYNCINWQEKLSSAWYISMLIFFAVIKSAYFLSTIGFMVAVFFTPGRLFELHCAFIFHWASCFYGGSLLLSCILLAILNKCDYDQYLLLRYIIFGVFLGIISILNALVGKAYFSIVQYRTFVSPTVSQENVAEVPAPAPAPSTFPVKQPNTNQRRVKAFLSRDPNGTLHGTVRSLGPLARFEDPTENPYNFCCKLAIAAKTISFLNLAYLVLEIIEMVISWNATPLGPHPLPPVFLEDMDQFYMCMREQEGMRYVTYIIVLILFAASKLVYFLATIGFMVGLFGSLGTKKEKFCFNIFIWSSFGYSGTLLLSRLLIAILKDRCPYYIWSKIIISSVAVAIFAVFNGLVARGYRDMVNRRRKIAEDLTAVALVESILKFPDEDEAPQIPASLSRSGAESIAKPLKR